MLNKTLGKKTLAVRSVESMLILRENADTPTDKDWDEFLDILVENRPRFPSLKILVMTDGGGPNMNQRKRLEKALDKRPVRVAVVSDSARVRFIVSTIAFLNPEIRTFSRKEIDDAYEHLSLTPRERKLAETAIEEMHHLIR
jgi:hypothetical protein